MDKHAVIFAVAIVIAATASAAPDALASSPAAESCVAEIGPDSVDLLQVATASAKWPHPGCGTFVRTCYTALGLNSTEVERHTRYMLSANWTSWRAGFGDCCFRSGYRKSLCEAIGAELFSLPNAKQLGLDGGDLVRDAPEPYLGDFCDLAGTLVHLDSKLATLNDAEGLDLATVLLGGLATSHRRLLQRAWAKASIGAGAGHLKRLGMDWEDERQLLGCTTYDSCDATPSEDACNQVPGMGKCCHWVMVPMPTPGVHTEKCKAKEEGDVCEEVGDDQGLCTDLNCTWDDICIASFPASAHVAVLAHDSGAVVEVAIEDLVQGQRLVSPEVPAMDLGVAEHMADAHAQDVGSNSWLLDFVEISHERMHPGRPLLITAEHLLFRSPGPSIGHVDGASGVTPVDAAFGLVPAGNVRVGDFVLALLAPVPSAPQVPGEPMSSTAGSKPGVAQKETWERSRVTGVRRVRARGAFSPLTTSGRLVVEGVAVSSYSVATEAGRRAWSSSLFVRRHFQAFHHLLLLPTRLAHRFGWDIAALHDPAVARRWSSVADIFLAGGSRLAKLFG